MTFIHSRIAVIIVIFLCQISISHQVGSGCSDDWTAREVVANKIYACPGTFSGGGPWGSAAATLCGSGYHICESAQEAKWLGLTEQKCRGMALNKGEFFATKETSKTDWQCYSDYPPFGSGRDDVWGCANGGIGANNLCYGTLTTVLFGNYWWDVIDPIYNINSSAYIKNEAVGYALTNSARGSGGVICCTDSIATPSLPIPYLSLPCRAVELISISSGIYASVVYPMDVCTSTLTNASGTVNAQSDFYYCNENGAPMVATYRTVNCEGTPTLDTELVSSYHTIINAYCDSDLPICDVVNVNMRTSRDLDCDDPTSVIYQSSSQTAYISNYCNALSSGRSTRWNCDGTVATYQVFMSPNCTEDGTQLSYTPDALNRAVTCAQSAAEGVDGSYSVAYEVECGGPGSSIPHGAAVSFPQGAVPIVVDTFHGDPYGRFEATIEVLVRDAENTLGISVSCRQCFIWQYRINNQNAELEWTDIAENTDITVHNKQVSSDNEATLYESSLIIQSSRTLNGGHCYDPDDISRIFKPGNVYEIRLQLLVGIDSNILLIETNSLPSDGVCLAVIGDHTINAEYIPEPLQEFRLLCMDWRNDANLEYNALIKNTILSKEGFVDDASELTSVAPAGEIEITVLIKEKDPNAMVACYNLKLKFKSIADTIHDRLNQDPSANSAAIVRDMMDDANAMIDATALAENPDVAISVASTIEGIYSYDSTIKPRAAEMINGIVTDIVDHSVTNAASGQDVITEISTIATVASNRDIVPRKTTTVLVDAYLPRVFDAMDASIADESIESQQSVLYAIAQQSQELIKNLESALGHATHYDDAAFTMKDDDNNNNNYLAATLVEYATLAASKALGKSSAGESFNFETSEYNDDGSIYSKKTIIATKFKASDANTTNCGTAPQNIELPPSLMEQGDSVFDCVFMSSSRDNFVSAQNRTQISDTITINIYGANSKYESNTSVCFPYFITMEANNNLSDYNASNMDLDKPYSFPSCNFWNINGSRWDTVGCFVYNISSTSVTCACTHLTTFSLSTDQIVPNADILSDIEDWKRFTIYNFLHYPTVWLTSLLFLVAFLIICYLNPRSVSFRNRTVLAYEDIIYKSVQTKQLPEDIIGKEIRYLTDYMPNQHLLGLGINRIASSNRARLSLCRMQWKLYLTYLQNDHTLLSVFQRSAGTNYSLKQRLGCFFSYLSNIMMVTGIYYGMEQSTPAQDVLASFATSLCSTLPVFIMRNLFLKSKPTEVKSSKHNSYGDDVDSSRLKSFIKGKKDITLSDFDDELSKLYGKENEEERIRAISAIRKALFDIMFPLPHKCKKIAWMIVVIWSFAATVVAIAYGFKFDLIATKVTNQTGSERNECWNSSLAMQIDHELSIKKFAEDYAAQQERNASSYAGGDAQSWLLSLFQSLLTSLILWQPLTVYVVTWIKLWMFSWHLKMKLGPGNIVRLCKRCCCGSVDFESRLVKLGSVNREAQRRQSRKLRDVIAHKNRPMDVISFLGNERWIIDDTNEEVIEMELCIEEGEEEDRNDVAMVIMVKDVCNDCGLLKTGKIYERDQLFYCLDCWEAYF